MSKYHNAFQGFVKVFTGAKQPGVKGSSTTIIGTKPNVGNLKKNQETFNKLKKITDTYVTKAGKVDPGLKKALRDSGSKSLQKTDKILRKNKKDGGRMGLKGGGSDMGSTTNKSINSLKNALANRKNRKKSKISSEQEEQKNMALQRVKDRPYNPEDDFDTYKKRTKAMGGNVYTAAEMKSKGGRIGRKFGGGADLKDIPAGKKFNGLRKLPKEVRNKMKYKKDGGKI
jgi:hypothetical protein